MKCSGRAEIHFQNRSLSFNTLKNETSATKGQAKLHTGWPAFSCSLNSLKWPPWLVFYRPDTCKFQAPLKKVWWPSPTFHFLQLAKKATAAPRDSKIGVKIRTQCAFYILGMSPSSHFKDLYLYCSSWTSGEKYQHLFTVGHFFLWLCIHVIVLDTSLKSQNYEVLEISWCYYR